MLDRNVKLLVDDARCTNSCTVVKDHLVKKLRFGHGTHTHTDRLLYLYY